MIVDHGKYILPLSVAKRTGTDKGDLLRFAGSSFYIDSFGTIATCSHIIESLQENEFLIAKELSIGAFFEVKNLRCHPKFDFALGQIDVTKSKFFKPANKELILGDDVGAIGFTASGKIGKDVHVETRMLRGYISRISEKPTAHIKGKSTFEVSFPSLAGFSGAPVTTHEGSFLAGMLFNNIESSIEVFSYSEIKDNDKKYSEKIHRIIEFGAVHPLEDIKTFLSDLKTTAFT